MNDQPSPDMGGIVNVLTELFGSLYGLPGYVIVGLSCIVVGYTLKLYRPFPNAAIPVVCICWGMIMNPLIAVAPTKGVPWRIWLVTNTLVGMIVGFAAWGVHNRWLKRFDRKIPVIGPKIEAASDSNKPK